MVASVDSLSGSYTWHIHQKQFPDLESFFFSNFWFFWIPVAHPWPCLNHHRLLFSTLPKEFLKTLTPFTFPALLNLFACRSCTSLGGSGAVAFCTHWFNRSEVMQIHQLYFSTLTFTVAPQPTLTTSSIRVSRCPLNLFVFLCKILRRADSSQYRSVAYAAPLIHLIFSTMKSPSIL